MARIVWHVGLWDNSYDNRIVQAATREMFSCRYKGSLIFVSIDASQNYFSHHLINKLNNEADLLLLSGELIHPTNNISGWRLNINTGDISLIKVPIVAYGISCSSSGKYCEERAWDSIHNIVSRSMAFSVSSEGVANLLEDNHVDVSEIDIVPDAPIFVKPDTYFAPSKDIKIGVHLDGLDASNARLFDTLLSQISKQYNAKIFLIEHLRDSSNIRYLFREDLSNIELVDDFLYPPTDIKVGFLADAYRNMTLTLGNGVSSNMMSFGQNVPFVALSTDDNSKYFVEYAELSNLQIKGKLETLQKNVTDIITNLNSYKNMIDYKKTEFTYIKDAFVDKVLENLGGNK